jgi:hypothetical protein
MNLCCPHCKNSDARMIEYLIFKSKKFKTYWCMCCSKEFEVRDEKPIEKSRDNSSDS